MSEQKTEQPEALRLAELMQAMDYDDTKAAAAELRQLHEKNEGLFLDAMRMSEYIATLERALTQAVEALEQLIHRAAPWGEQDWLDGNEALATARQTLGGKHD